MTREQAVKLLSADEAAAAIEEGTLWGRQEAELWQEQYFGRNLPPWIFGTYAGRLPGWGDDAKREAYATLVELAAQDAWNNS